ncbi:hypothetical protein SMD44_08832 [Streptomyces alboflavus]|uniref:Uncharacterized protein n=1 Tax=Streptomyces alboflavus TaxID=67267 RepID=A0A1Z1WSD7_9ACTN|nr:hypothetical protein SMD44_08832 [Streptomyces alboflavus]
MPGTRLTRTAPSSESATRCRRAISRAETERSASTAIWLVRGSMPQDVPVILARDSNVSMAASSWAALRSTRLGSRRSRGRVRRRLRW